MNSFIPKLIGTFINFIGVFAPKYAGKLAIQLFSIPRKGALKPNDLTFLNTATQKKISYKNFAIQTYQWKNSGDTVVLAHGWESNSSRWKDLIQLLQERHFNIIALDAPAHGATGNKQFNAVLYSECINEVVSRFQPKILIGHSVGGMASVFAMHNHNMESITKLILLGAPDAFSTILNSYETVMRYNGRTKTAIRNYILKTFNFLPEDFSTSKFTSTLNAKALIIHDKKDRIIPFQDGVTIKNNYPKSQFIETKGYGHGLKSTEVYNHILSFLKA
jgi:pimeloyl-ACP methyl ester carboxylesterase